MESSTFSLLSRECMAWLCGINENDYIPQQVTAYWNIHIRCDSWVVKADSNCVSKQEVFDMGATLIIRSCSLFWSFLQKPYMLQICSSLVTTSAPCVDSSCLCPVLRAGGVMCGVAAGDPSAAANYSPCLTKPEPWPCPAQSAALFLGRLPLTININNTQLSRYASSLHQSMCLMEHQHQCLGVYTLQTFTTERNSLNEPYHDAVKIDGDNLNNNKR